MSKKPTIQERLRERAMPDQPANGRKYESIKQHGNDWIPGYDAELDLRAADKIDELKREIERRDRFDGCDGCSTGDCPHDSTQMCIAAQGKIIAEQSAVIHKDEDERHGLPSKTQELASHIEWLLELIKHETGLPDSAENGVTDQSGSLDEGVVRAATIMDDARQSAREAMSVDEVVKEDVPTVKMRQIGTRDLHLIPFGVAIVIGQDLGIYREDDRGVSSHTVIERMINRANGQHCTERLIAMIKDADMIREAVNDAN